MSVCLSVCLSVYQMSILSIYLSTYLSISTPLFILGPLYIFETIRARMLKFRTLV